MANLEPMPISSLPEGSIQDGDKMIIYRDSNGKAYQSDASSMESVAELKEEVDQISADLTDLNILGGGGTAIPDNDDLNDYITPGKYYTNSSNFSSVVNAPYQMRFTLLVMAVRGNSRFVVQIFICAGGTPYIFVRYGDNGTWYSWYQLSLSAVNTSSVGDPVVMGEDDA